MNIPKETGWTHTLEEQRHGKPKSVFSAINSSSKINIIKIDLDFLTIIEVGGPDIDALYNELLTINEIAPYVGDLIKGEIYLSVLGSLKISVTCLMKKAGDRTELLLNALFTLIERDFEPTFAAVKPFIIEILKTEIFNSTNSAPSSISEINTNITTMMSAIDDMLLNRRGFKSSSIWDEQVGTDRYEPSYRWKPLDQTLALKEIHVKKQVIGLSNGIEFEVMHCNPELAKAFKQYPILSQNYRERSSSRPISYEPVVKLPGEHKSFFTREPINTLSIEITSVPNGDKALNHVFDILETFIPHVSPIRAKVKEALKKLGYIDEESARFIFNPIVSHCIRSIPENYALEFGSADLGALSQNGATLGRKAKFVHQKDSIDIFQSLPSSDRGAVSSIATYYFTRYTWEYNSDYWDREQRVYQSVSFHTAEQAQQVYELLEASPLKSTAQVWDVSIKGEKLHIARFPTMIALVEMLYADEEHRQLIIDHLEWSKLAVKLDKNKITPCPLLPIISQQTNSSVQESSLSVEGLVLAEDQQNLKSPSHISGTVFHSREPIKQQPISEIIRRQLG